MSFPFFAYLSRLRLIHRWSLMRNTVPENDAEHSLQVAMIAHAIAIIARDRYGKDVDPEHVLSNYVCTALEDDEFRWKYSEGYAIDLNDDGTKDQGCSAECRRPSPSFPRP